MAGVMSVGMTDRLAGGMAGVMSGMADRLAGGMAA